MTRLAAVADWEDDALCRAAPDMWTTRSRPAVKIALHACRTHCPVLDQCRAAGAGFAPDRRHSVVLGGVAYGHHGMPASCQAEQRCPTCRRRDHRLRRAARYAA